MKKCLLALPLAALLAQTPPQTKPDEVVANLNGRASTRAEFERLLLPLSPANKLVVMRDPSNFLQNLAWLEVMVKMAEEQKLDRESPYRERIEQLRSQILAQALVDTYSNNVKIMPDVQRKHFDDNKAKYKQVKGRLIFIPIGQADGAKKGLSEEEAKAKANAVAGQAKMGADFVKLVREHSQDPGTKSKDGDLGEAVNQSATKIPEPMRNAILALKSKGQTTDPVRLPNGYYIFQATEVTEPTYDQVRDEIYKELQNAEVQKWVDGLRKQATAKVENPAYFQQGSK
jgi:peptidyl-prolyl cis-trans isomerase C